MSFFSRAFYVLISQLIFYLFQLLTPIVLVRLIDVASFGIYKEFILFSSLAFTFINFSNKYNLLYFLASDPTNEKKYVANTLWISLSTSILGVLALWGIQSAGLVSWDSLFLIQLLVYVALLNFDFLDSYWIAKKQQKSVVYFSAIFATLRFAITIFSAVYFETVSAIINGLILIEVLRCIFSLLYVVLKKRTTFCPDYSLLKKQFVYLVPLGVSASLFYLNNQLGSLFVSSYLGVTAFAIYAIGSQNLPFINIIRNAVNSVLLPDLTEKITKGEKGSLSVWKQSTLLYFQLSLPLFFVFFIYAKPFILWLFTDKYLSATSVFQVYLLLTLKKSFELGLPLKAINKNRYFVIGYVIMLIINVLTLVLLKASISYFTLFNISVSVVFSELISAGYLLTKVKYFYKESYSSLLLFTSLKKTVAYCLIPLPLLSINFILIDLTPISTAVCVCLYVISVGYFYGTTTDKAAGMLAAKIRNLLTKKFNL